MVRALLARLPLERLTPVWFGITVLTFTLGSSIFTSVKAAAGKGKWGALVILFVLAVGLALRSRPLRWSPLHTIVVALLALMVVSATWSVAATTTAKHAVTLIFMLGAAAALGFAASADPGLVRRLGTSLAIAATVLGVAGLATVVLSPSHALLRGTGSSPTRLRGITENPDTAPLLLVLALPFLVLGCVEATTRRRRALWIAATATVFATLIATLSRGGWIAAFAGSLVLVGLFDRRRTRLAAVAAVVLCWGIGVSVELAANARGAPPAGAVAVGDWAYGYPSQQGYTGQMAEELYQTGSGGWALLGTSGRAGAWRGTVRQALQRPLLGFGFGTEDRVFFDRYFNFQGGSSEDSYVGMLLQLGFVGLAGLLAALAAAVIAVVRLFGRNRRLAVVLGAAIVAGVVLAITQSYLYAAGNISALPFWVLAFSGAGLAEAAHA